ncbi:MAG: type I-E CRISPR-associated protein Cas6/Cse3/CasE [Betaproteobacteria bacterium]|nr:type I-E CRISPR-associated protein Cas6/Cse3/CasE [Betaproteobacteria bacterium]
MFLSRIEMPWKHGGNPYELHRHIWRLFPGEDREARKAATEQRQGFLFRIEQYQTGRPVRLLVQSRRAPAPVSVAWPEAKAGPEVWLLGTREINPRPSVGQRLAFVLTANPVKTITDKQRDRKEGKKAETCRVPLLKEADQREWLLRKLASAAELEAVSVLPHQLLFFRKGRMGGKLVTVTFEGVLKVHDPDQLLSLLENGVGPAKGFGCGLLLVRRADEAGEG